MLLRYPVTYIRYSIYNIGHCATCEWPEFYYGRPWPAVYINFVLKIHQIQVLTEPLCRAQASFYALPNNERGTKYRGL